MKRFLGILIVCGSLLMGSVPVPTHASAASDAAGNSNYYTVLSDAISTDWNFGNGIKKFLEVAPTKAGAEGISDFVVNLVVKFVIPLLAIAGIILAIVGFFKLMSSDDPAELKKGWNFILRGLVGTLIMVSAAWIVMQMVGADGTGGFLQETVIGKGEAASGAELASTVYGTLFYPFIKVILNIIIGILFLLAVGSTFKYLFSGDDTAQKKAISILTYTVVGILAIILAKDLVEAVYGKYDTVINTAVIKGGQDLGKIGTGVFEDPQLEMLYVVLNRVLGLATFIVTIIIIYIGYLLLVQPTSDETAGKLKKAIMRAFGGILLIGVAYLIANFMIVK